MTPRGHAASRLATRAGPAAADRGFRLLRARAALATFLDEWARVDSDYAVDVVAFALEPGDRAAHALVDRDGNGVTCLGPGMAVNAPIVPWAATSEFLQAQDRALHARRALLAARDADEHHSPLVRVVEHPHRLVRDEVLALRALLPLVGVAHHQAAVEAAVGEVVAVLGGKRTSERALQASWRLLLGGVAGLVVAGNDPALFGPATAAIATGEPRLGVPALWQLVHHPAQTLQHARACVDVDSPLLQDTLLDVVLPALAFRNVGFAADAAALVRLLQRRRGRDVTGLPDADVVAVDFARQLLLVLPYVLRRLCPDDVLAAHRAHGEALAAQLAQAQGVDEVFALASPWASLVLRAWALPARRAAPPRTAPRAIASLTDVERVALALWRSVVVDAPLPLVGAGPLLALLVVHAPVEALLPGDEPDPALALGKGVAWLKHELPGLLGAPPSTTTSKTKAQKTKAPKATSRRRDR
jgi:hypothetical protein